MAKIYLVDSENIGASWSQLLSSMSETDRMYVFYTEKSPYVSYENLMQVIAYSSIPVFIKCFEGRNALDFQLVTELGFQLSQGPEDEYIIISDDYGYDAAIKYWTGRNYSVRRIGKKSCRPIQSKKQEEIVVIQSKTKAIQAEVPVTDRVEGSMELPIQSEVEVQVNEEASAVFERVEVQENVQIPGQEISRGEPEGEHMIMTEPEVEQTPKAIGEKSTEEEQSAAKTAADEIVPKSARARRRKRRKEAATESETADMMKAENSVVQEPVEAGSGTAELTAKDLIRSQIAEMVVKCNSPDPEKDSRCVLELFRTISMNDLTTVNTAMKILLGNELGNDIYREVKEHQECRQQLDALYYPAMKDRFKHYVQLVMERNELQGITAEEISKFLLRIPRKNLNSIRSAMLKEYGNELGAVVYTVFKSHIKVLNKI